VIFEGYIKIPITGEYIFYLETEDSGEVILNNNIIIDKKKQVSNKMVSFLCLVL